MLPDPVAAPVPPYEFLQVNGFVYRGNRLTGEMYRLEVDKQDRKKQVWTKIEDRTAAAH